MFSKNLINAIQEVSGQIAPDALSGYSEEEYGCSEAELLAEMTLDASRLATFGHPEADAELRRLYDEHGIQAVLAEAELHICH